MDITAGFPLARFTVDRAAHLRSNPSWLSEVLADETTRILLIHDGQVAVTDELSLHLVKPESVQHVPDLAHRSFLLGADDEHTYVGVMVHERDEHVVLWVSMRDVGANMNSRDVGLSVTATALAVWHSTHQHCPACGAKTDLVEAGWARRCPADDGQLFPRTEPAVIVAVTDHADRLLLGRRTNWPAGWYSIVAGFVEAGESCEHAVIREVLEETGVHLQSDSLHYLGSQPWPFPASLMLAYRATARTTELHPDGSEIAELQWVSVTELREHCQSGDIKLPNPSSIAWHVIQGWFGSPLDVAWSRG